jgi:hypothetical protein
MTLADRDVVAENRAAQAVAELGIGLVAVRLTPDGAHDRIADGRISAIAGIPRTHPRRS